MKDTETFRNMQLNEQPWMAKKEGVAPVLQSCIAPWSRPLRSENSLPICGLPSTDIAADSGMRTSDDIKRSVENRTNQAARNSQLIDEIKRANRELAALNSENKKQEADASTLEATGEAVGRGITSVGILGGHVHRGSIH